MKATASSIHSIGDKYVRAVAEVALCSPVMIPSMIDALRDSTRCSTISTAS